MCKSRIGPFTVEGRDLSIFASSDQSSTYEDLLRYEIHGSSGIVSSFAMSLLLANRIGSCVIVNQSCSIGELAGWLMASVIFINMSNTDLPVLKRNEWWPRQS